MSIRDGEDVGIFQDGDWIDKHGIKESYRGRGSFLLSIPHAVPSSIFISSNRQVSLFNTL
jgi:hypothetical protein